MSRKNLMLAMAGAMMAMASDPFMGRTSSGYAPRFKKPESREELYSQPRTFTDSRQLREFSIKGHKVMAYSKKDAITRLKHQKKL